MQLAKDPHALLGKSRKTTLVGDRREPGPHDRHGVVAHAKKAKAPAEHTLARSAWLEQKPRPSRRPAPGW